MQKRTNPLALKMDAASKQGASDTKQTLVPPVEEAPRIEEPVVEIEAPVKESVAPAVEETVEVAPEITPEVAPAEEKKPPLAKRQVPVAPVRAEVEEEPAAKEEHVIEKAAPVMGGAVQWQMVTNKKTEQKQESVRVPVVVSWSEPPKAAEPQPPVQQQEAVAEPEEEIFEQFEEEVAEEDILGEEQAELAAPSDEPAAQEMNAPLSEDAILDEQLPPAIEDYEMAARFLLCGRVSRGMKIGKLSRDVCRLAQLMHPNESLSSILEGALLTRIYLENRDAFDALAEMLEKKGGHIKC